MPTIQDLQRDHQQKVEKNRALGVQQWNNGEEQDRDRVFEVVDGFHHVPPEPGKTKIKLAPGRRLHLTKRQVEQTLSDKGALRGKVRELTGSELRDIHRHERPIRSTGADFREMELKALKMADSTFRAAYDGGLSGADFEGIEPEGSDGRYTRTQVDALVELKATDPAA